MSDLYRAWFWYGSVSCTTVAQNCATEWKHERIIPVMLYINHNALHKPAKKEIVKDFLP